MKLRQISLAIVAALATGTALADGAAPAPAQPPASVPLVSQDALLAREQQHDAALFLLDVRSADEFAKGHVPGAVNIPHDQVASRLAEIPRDRDVVLYCHSGRRAGIAAGVLAANGYTRLSHLEGDMMGWVEKNRPIELPDDAKAAKPQ